MAPPLIKSQSGHEAAAEPPLQRRSRPQMMCFDFSLSRSLRRSLWESHYTSNLQLGERIRNHTERDDQYYKCAKILLKFVEKKPNKNSETEDSPLIYADCV